MSKQIQEAYIVAATRLPVAKKNGMFRNVRPDDMLAHAIKSVVAQVPGIDPALIGDVIVGCAMPEAEQGMNVARIGLLLAGLPITVPGITINRFCSSGVEAVADAANQIRLGLADVMIAAGTESMSVMPQIMGNKMSMNPAIFAKMPYDNIRDFAPISVTSPATTWKPSPSSRTAGPAPPSRPVISRPRFRPIPSAKACPIWPPARFASASGSPIPTKARVPIRPSTSWPS